MSMAQLAGLLGQQRIPNTGKDLSMSAKTAQLDF
jgi:hypothetical protein